MASSAAGPSAAVTTEKPSRSRYVRTSRTIFASSSTTRIGAAGTAGSVIEFGIASMVGVDSRRRSCRSSDERRRQVHCATIRSLDLGRVALEPTLDRRDDSKEERPNQHLPEVLDIGDRV